MLMNGGQGVEDMISSNNADEFECTVAEISKCVHDKGNKTSTTSLCSCIIFSGFLQFSSIDWVL